MLPNSIAFIIEFEQAKLLKMLLWLIMMYYTNVNPLMSHIIYPTYYPTTKRKWQVISSIHIGTWWRAYFL